VAFGKSMKNVFILIIFVIIFISLTDLFADEIRLKGGTTIKCKIIQVTPKYIEYDPEGSRIFDMIPRDQVIEIIYDDGTKIKFNKD
jgi:hypothetical protein